MTWQKPVPPPWKRRNVARVISDGAHELREVQIVAAVTVLRDPPLDLHIIRHHNKPRWAARLRSCR